jgi:hypothetical protein
MDHSQARGQQKNPQLPCRGIRERDITKLSVQFVLGAAAHGEHRFARFRRAFGDASANIASGPGVRVPPEGVEVDPQRITTMISGSAKTTIR